MRPPSAPPRAAAPEPGRPDPTRSGGCAEAPSRSRRGPTLWPRPKPQVRKRQEGAQNKVHGAARWRAVFFFFPYLSDFLLFFPDVCPMCFHVVQVLTEFVSCTRVPTDLCQRMPRIGRCEMSVRRNGWAVDGSNSSGWSSFLRDDDI